jgi:hypothetical protein
MYVVTFVEVNARIQCVNTTDCYIRLVFDFLIEETVASNKYGRRNGAFG